MSATFLDEEDLQRLTGYKRPAEQARWLEGHGIPYLRNCRGRLVVRCDFAAQEAEPELGPVP